MAIEWDPDRLKFRREDFLEALRQGEPRIEVTPTPVEGPRLELSSWMLEPGEEKVVARRCAEVLNEFQAKA